MNIEIGNFRITTDRYNFILSEKREVNQNHHNAKQSERFIEVGYFGKIEHLVNHLLNRHLLGSNANTLLDIQTSLHRIENELKNDVEKLISEINRDDDGIGGEEHVQDV